MKVGDLVIYKPYPHAELRRRLGPGIVSRAPYNRDDCNEKFVDVVWSKDRPQVPAGTPMWEFLDELEKVNG